MTEFRHTFVLEKNIIDMNKLNHILTYWFKIKLKRKDKESIPWRSDEDNLFIMKLYDEYEERKRSKKINISLLFEDNFKEKII